MPKFDVTVSFADYNLATLEEIAAALQKMIADRQLAEMAAVKKQLEALATKKGYTLDQLLGKPRKQNVVAPKYRGAEGQTWTGRGRAPDWMPKNKEQWDKLLISATEHAQVASALQ